MPIQSLTPKHRGSYVIFLINILVLFSRATIIRWSEVLITASTTIAASIGILYYFVALPAETRLAQIARLMDTRSTTLVPLRWYDVTGVFIMIIANGGRAFVGLNISTVRTPRCEFV